MTEGLRRRRRPYLNIPSSTVNDRRLTLKARGLLNLILDKPDGWVVRADAIARECDKDGRDAIGAGLRELAEHGYYRLERRRLRDGTFAMGNAVSEEPVASWVTDHRDYAGKAVPLIQQPDGTFLVKRRDGSLVDDGFETDAADPPEPASMQVGPVTGFPEPDEPEPDNPVTGEAGSGEPVTVFTTEESLQRPPPLRGGRARAGTPARTREAPVESTPPQRRKRKTPWPGQFNPTDRHVAWAGKHYPAVDVAAETAAFNAYWDAPERVDSEREWAASWRSWIEQAAKRGPSRVAAPVTADELEQVRPLGDRWWTVCETRGLIYGEQRADLDARLVEAVRTGADQRELATALYACREPVPPMWKLTKALRGEIKPLGTDGRPVRRSTTDDRVAQVGTAVEEAKAQMAARRAATGGLLASGGRP